MAEYEEFKFPDEQDDAKAEGGSVEDKFEIEVEDDTPDDDSCEYCGDGDRVPKEDADRMRAILARIAYPSRGTPDETADINAFAAEIQAAWSLESLTENSK